MKIKQRDANKAAIEMAAAMVRDADLMTLFGDLAECAATPAEEEHNDAVMAKAQAAALKRIEQLLGGTR